MAKVNKSKEYIKNTFILFIGKFATQFTSFLLIPLFTRYLLKDDYGWTDLLQSYIFLLVPILTLRLDSAIFRFLIDNRKDEKGKKKIISNIIFLLSIITFSSLLLCLVLIKLIHFKYIYSCLINIVILMISNVLIQVLRGLGKNKEYSVSSIITGITSIAVNTLLIIKYGYKANSIFIASSISNTIVIVYVVLTTKLYKYLSIKEINKNTIKEILNYSLPMIPNSLSWWIVSVSDRTIISIILGTALNGIYTVSCKFSNILNSIFGVFNMSWQETVSVHINDQDRNEFFSKMINRLFILFSSISLLIMLALPFVYNILIGKEYLESYKYIPILLYANSWYVLSSLLGGIYIGLKQTKKIANTTIASAIINIVINILLMNKIGLYAACISTLISYLAMSIYRYIDLKKYLNIKISLRNIMISTLLFCIGYIVFFI